MPTYPALTKRTRLMLWNICIGASMDKFVQFPGNLPKVRSSSAGRGAKLTLLGQVEMDAAVMQGDSMNAGTDIYPL